MMDDRKNVVLVTADSIRADYCGFLGGPDTTPFLTNTPLDSVVFETAIAPGPRTPSSVPVSMTGEWYRTERGGQTTDRLELISNHVRRFRTISRRLQSDGYTTAAITANPWTTVATGFDELFDDFQEIGSGYGVGGERTTLDKLLDYIGQWRRNTDWFAQWTNYYDDIQERLDRLDEPWFLWVFLLDTHSPYIVPRQYRTESTTIGMYYSVLRYNLSVMRGNPQIELSPRVHDWTTRAYRDSIRSIDAFVETLASDIDPERTAIVFHSDHGDSMREHGSYGHQDQLYEENLHVPMTVLSAGSSTRVSEPVSLIRLPDIIAQVSEDRLDPQAHTSDVTYSRTEFGEVDAVRGSRFKLISTQDSERDQLYDLKEDPTEQTNLYGERPEVEEVLNGYLRRRRSAIRERIDISRTVGSVLDTGTKNPSGKSDTC